VIRESPLADVQSDFWLAVTASPDGSWLAVDQQVFNASDGAVLADLPNGTHDRSSASCPGRDVVLTVGNFARKADNRTLTDVVAFDFKAQAVVAVFRGPEKHIERLAVSADGKVLAAGASEGNVFVWNLTQLK
jgi:WD40 repeat protein